MEVVYREICGLGEGVLVWEFGGDARSSVFLHPSAPCLR